MCSKIIGCLIICLMLPSMVGGQAIDKKEIKRFCYTLDSLLSNTPDGACKKAIEKYRKSIFDLKFDNLEEAVAKFLSAGDAFEAKPGKTCTRVETLIKETNAALQQEYSGLSSRTDSLALLDQFIYLQHTIWGYLEVALHITGREKQPFIPSLKISPSIQFVVKRSLADTTVHQLFVFPASTFEVTAEAEGYTSWKQRVDSIVADTSFTILMESNAATPPNDNTIEEQPKDLTEKQSSGNPYKLVSMILGAIVLLFLGRLVLMKRKAATSPVITTPASVDIPIQPPTIPMKQSINPAKENAYFLAEIMMTAGPRKSSGTIAPDRDLGEDVCGFVNSGDQVLMWVLDGASDYFSERNPDTGKEYFSSRLLAQSIAGKLKQQFAAINADSFQKIVTGIIESVKTDWMDVVRSLPAGEIEALQNSVKDGRFPECAATILIAKLSLSGKLEVYRSGDCKLFYYREEPGKLKYVPSSLSEKNSKSNDWLFFRMVETADGALDILHNTPLFEVVSETGIQTIIGVSDGIGRETVESLSSDQAQDKETLRMKLIQQVQGTGDDKSLCMIEIKKGPLS